jgi:hypothetical protein
MNNTVLALDPLETLSPSVEGQFENELAPQLSDESLQTHQLGNTWS